MCRRPCFQLAIALVLIRAPFVSAKEPQPVANGEFRIVLGGKRIGQETFVVRKAKTYTVTSETTLYWPEPSRYELRYELGSSFRVEKLALSVSHQGEMAEAKLEPKKGIWRLEVRKKGDGKLRQELGARDRVEVELPSLLLHGFVIRRLGLNPGEERSVEMAIVGLPEIIAEQTGRVYRRLQDEEITIPAMEKVLASVYELQNANSTYRVWLSPSGVALRGHFESPHGKIEHELARLDEKPGAWEPIRTK